MRPEPTRRPRRGGFTLIELLVVILIVVLVSAAALPVILPAIRHRQVSEGARILQAGLAAARDAAIRNNAPRGIRLLPDPLFSGPNTLTPNGNNPLNAPLASNRFVPIEPAPDYSVGRISLGTPYNNIVGITVNGDSSLFTLNGVEYAPLVATNFAYPYMHVADYPYAYGRIGVQQSFSTLTTTQTSGTTTQVWLPNNPTAWAWNIRQGDKLRFDDSGRSYTIAGPMFVGIYDATSGAVANPERFINYGLPGQSSYVGPEFLFLVNGQDDDNDGWVDEGFDGVDNDGDGIIDPGFNGIDDDGDGHVDNVAELFYAAPGYSPGGEFEPEAFVGAQFNNIAQANGNTNVTDAGTTYATAVGFSGTNNSTPAGMQDYPAQAYYNQPYTISRRPVVSDGARETLLPSDIVIDLTSWNAASAISSTNGASQPSLPERSRLPVDPYTYYVDILVAPNGQVVPAAAGAAAANSGSLGPSSNLPFYHFWLSERQDVYPPVWQSKGVKDKSKAGFQVVVPLANPGYISPSSVLANASKDAASIQTYAKNNRSFLLPMPADATDSADATQPKFSVAYPAIPALKGERRLVTLFTRSGLLTTTEAFNFYYNDTNAPYYEAQLGVRESAK